MSAGADLATLSQPWPDLATLCGSCPLWGRAPAVPGTADWGLVPAVPGTAMPCHVIVFGPFLAFAVAGVRGTHPRSAAPARSFRTLGPRPRPPERTPSV